MNIEKIDNVIADIAKCISKEAKGCQLTDIAELTKALAELLTARALFPN